MPALPARPFPYAWSLVAGVVLAMGSAAGSASQVPPAGDPDPESAPETSDPDEGLEPPVAARKPVDPKRIRFDARKFFAAWESDAAEFDYDASGTVDCGDLEVAARAAKAVEASRGAGGIVPKGDAKGDTKTLRPAGRPTAAASIVQAWGTNAVEFDFDGNGIVGCADVAGYISNGLKPRKPGEKPLDAPSAGPGSTVDPSTAIPITPASATGGEATVGSSPSGAARKGPAGKADSGGRGRSLGGAGGGAGGGGGGGAGGSSPGRASARTARDAPDGGLPGNPDDGPDGSDPDGGGVDDGGDGDAGGGGGDDGGNEGGDDEPIIIPGLGETSIRYEVGDPGKPDHSVFQWIVTGVRQKGTFVDGTPWITVEPGAALVDLSPKSIRRRMSNGLEVWTNGSAKNPRAILYADPVTGGIAEPTPVNFDGRCVRYSLPTQAEVDASFNLAANIGIVPPGNRTIVPVALVPGDVVFTADCEWVEVDNRRWGDNGGAAPHTTPGRRSAIKRFGILTVLAEAPAAPSFRPPSQWIRGQEATRPAPIPVSRVRTDESALLHRTPLIRTNTDIFLTSPTFRDGGGIMYQSSHAIFAFTTDLSKTSNMTYGGNLSKGVLCPALLQATNTAIPADRRLRIRNRLIQYGIDCYGSVVSLVKSGAGAGQRAAELKPWILLAGWWLDSPEMRNPYQAIRDFHPGSALASKTDAELGWLFFQDDKVCCQVVGGIGLGSAYVQTWGPGNPNRVRSASEVSSTMLAGIQPVEGRFARLEVTGVSLPGGDGHSRTPGNYYGMYVHVVSGPGAGPTIYRVVRVGGRSAFADFLELDRPWASGPPDPSSTVRMFPFRNGDVLPGDLSDVGRWYFSREGHDFKLEVDDLSPLNDGYAAISARSFIVPYSALKRLAEHTGNTDYLRGTTWNWLAEIVGGTGTAPGGERYGACPDSDRILNLFWDADAYVGGPSTPVVRQWLRADGRPGSYGYRDLSRLPGARR